MKSFLSAASAAFAVLFLAVSLSGCLGEEKTASQSGNVESSMFDSGKIKLVLKPGVRYLQLYYSKENPDYQHQGDAIVGLLRDNGVKIEKAGWQISPSGGYYKIFVRVSEDTSVNISKSDIDAIVVGTALGIVASWQPMQGNEVRYEG